MEIKALSPLQDFEKFFPILLELRPHLTPDSFHSIFRAAEEDRYQLVGAFDRDELVGVMGFRFLTDFVHGRHLYIDDLVVTAKSRSFGVGKALLIFAETQARENDCQGLRLCTGFENERGRSFYEREGWIARAIAFKKRFT